MTEWFHETFDELYLKLYAHRDDEEASRMVRWLTQELDLKPGELVLDAPCGAGRHSRAFARKGFRVVGLDLSNDLLTAARATTPLGENLVWVRADLRWLPISTASCDLVANIFSSFGYFLEEAENLRVVKELVRVLRPQGHFVLDFMNALHVRANLLPYSERTTNDGWHLREWRQIVGSPPRVEKVVSITFPDGTERTLRESVRLYERWELEALLTSFGITNLRVFGHYDGSAWQQDSPRTILLGQKGN